MDFGGSLQPEEDLDVETVVVECHQLGLTEAGLALEGLFVVGEETVD